MEQVVNVARKSCNSRANVRNPSLLKVSKSRKKLAILPKNEQKVRTLNMFFSFFVFFERIENCKNCFRDLLIFTTTIQLLLLLLMHYHRDFPPFKGLQQKNLPLNCLLHLKMHYPSRFNMVNEVLAQYEFTQCDIHLVRGLKNYPLSATYHSLSASFCTK